MINAIPPAAAVPRRNAVGSGQNGGVALYMPTAATHRAANARAGAPARALAPRPAAATHADAATCRRRSPVRSEWLATAIIAMAAQRNGSADQKPTAASDD